MPRARYEAEKVHLAEVHEEEGISFIPMQELGAPFFEYLGRAPRAWRTLWESVRRSDVVHSGLSSDLARPLGFVATLAAVIQNKPATFVVDIDFRESARMNYRTKRWSLKSYLLCRHVYDPLRVAQIRFAIRHCSLVLLKSRRMVEAFGGGESHVKDFLDAAHSEEHVIGADDIRRREARLDRRDEPLRLVYFGRLVGYKGVDRAIVALSMARRRSGRDFTLDVIGAGEEEPNLRRLAGSLGLATRVAFRGAIPYGPVLFDALCRADLAVATPLAEDTPRSAIDAFAAGIPIVAFDLSYYRDLARGGAVLVAPWLDVRAVAEGILELDEERDRLKTMIRSAVEFARRNTQEIWLERRVAWTVACTRARSPESSSPPRLDG